MAWRLLLVVVVAGAEQVVGGGSSGGGGCWRCWCCLCLAVAASCSAEMAAVVSVVGGQHRRLEVAWRLLLVVAVAVAEAEVVGRLSAWLVEAAATLFEVAAEVSVIGSGGVGFIRGFCWRRWRHCLCSVMVAAATLFGGGNIGS